MCHKKNYIFETKCQRKFIRLQILCYSFIATITVVFYKTEKGVHTPKPHQTCIITNAK